MTNAFQIAKFASEQALDTAANVLAGATMTFSLTGTSTATNAYADSTLVTPLANPLSADAAGAFVQVFLDPAIIYRVVLKTSAGVVLKTWDPANEQLLSQALIGFYLYPRTASEISASITPTSYAYAPGDVRRYGADPTGVSDSLAAFTAALAAQNPVSFTPKQAAFALGGTFRVDDTVVIEDYCQLSLYGNAKLIRKSSGSANTTPVVQVKGNYASLEGGQLWSENNSPTGVLNCGHRDSTSNYNSLFWRVHNTQVFGKDWLGTQASFSISAITKANPAVVSAAGHNFTNGQPVFINGATGMTQVNHRTYTVAGAVAGVSFQLSGVDSSAYGVYTGGATVMLAPSVGDIIGIYMTSSQPFLGNTANYFGTISNCKVHSSTQAVVMTDLANGHTLENVSWEGIWYYGFHLNGAYGNRFSGGFMGTAYADGFINMFLEPKASPGATFASSLESVRNHFMGFTIENATSNNFGFYTSNANCTGNYAEFAFNSTGTAITDSSNGNLLLETSSAGRFNALTVNAATPTGTGNQVSFGITVSSTVGAAGAATVLPSNPSGYLSIDIGGAKRKIPYYNP